MTIIRQAVPQDIPRIMDLYEELMEEKNHASEETLKRVLARITSLPDSELLVSEKDGLVVGSLFILIVPNLSHDAQPWTILENMIVDSRYRGQGIGRLLMERAINRSREAGCYKVQLLSHKKRLAAHQFYRDLGFQDSALGFRLYLSAQTSQFIS